MPLAPVTPLKNERTHPQKGGHVQKERRVSSSPTIFHLPHSGHVSAVRGGASSVPQWDLGEREISLGESSGGTKSGPPNEIFLALEFQEFSQTCGPASLFW